MYDESARKAIKLFLMTNKITHKSCPPYLIKFLSGAGASSKSKNLSKEFL
jgi:hypothetical protein